MKFLPFLAIVLSVAHATVLLHDNVEVCVVSPNSAQVACTLDGGNGLAVVPRDGSAAATVLVSGPEVAGSIDEVRWADNGRLVYWGDAETGGRDELFAVPAGTPGAYLRISSDLAGLGANVQGDWEVTPDGTRAVYRADRDTVDQFELYSAPTDGSSAAVELSPAMPPTGDVQSFRATDTHVFFIARDSGSGRDHLWSVPVDGSASATDLSPSVLTVGHHVRALAVSPDGTRVAYFVDGAADVREAHVSGGYETLLHGTTSADILLWTSDGATVVWCDTTVWAAPSNTTGAAVRQTPQAGTIERCQLSPDDAYVVWFGDLETTNVDELWSAALSTVSAPTPVKLNGLMTADSDVWDFFITPDSATVIYNADQTANLLDQIFYGPIGGPASSYALLDPAFEGRCKDGDWALSADGSWLVCNAFFDLYRATSIPGTMELVQESVDAFTLAPDSSGMVYVTGAAAYGLSRSGTPLAPSAAALLVSDAVLHLKSACNAVIDTGARLLSRVF